MIIPFIPIAAGIVLVTNVGNLCRLYYEALKKTYGQMGEGAVNRISRLSMLPTRLSFMKFRVLTGGVLIIGGAILLVSGLGAIHLTGLTSGRVGAAGGGGLPEV